MREWIVAHYAFLKDFAGPIATIFAATVAAGVALIFGIVQWRIASSQRDIARDNLKFALLQRRYEIYDAAKRLLEHIALTHTSEKSDINKIRSWYVQIEEAHFYFPDYICAYLRQITNATEAYFKHVAERDLINLDHTEKWHAQAELLAHDLSVLRKYYADLPNIFKRPLAFKQLTKG